MKRILFALVAVGFLAAATSTASAATDTIYAPRDCTKPKIEPKSITLTCGDAQTVLKHLHWEDWNGPKVKGDSDLSVNNCDPTCADGSIDKFEVEVRLPIPKPYMCGGSDADHVPPRPHPVCGRRPTPPEQLPQLPAVLRVGVPSTAGRVMPRSRV